ncbi:hypothetical protein LOK49_LG10G02458 [Camellia lanceoleosa]|uniref:Uncharacterized protein n=1 Tax=Camellia lanceoleosa TaxID=1840588 RepID=A0ACC0GEL9_9ERIC|nr:hypothetical protein LOK49_LG10G02458 [Camellia lanceoleosa]
MWLVGELEKIEGRVRVLDEEDDRVGARRYMRTKLRMQPTTRVEKTKSSSFRPKLGRVAMSPRTHALTPTSSSITTLNGNWGSAATLDLHPFRKAPNGPLLHPPPAAAEEEKWNAGRKRGEEEDAIGNEGGG